jgi:hypothetical protein
MRFTQAQVRQLVGISEETFRTWRKALTPLQGRPGHSPNFSAADVLALAAIEWMVHSLGIKISHLEMLAEDLFGACVRAAAPGMNAAYILVAKNEVRLLPQQPLAFDMEEGVILIPVKMLLKSLNASMQKDIGNGQLNLPFPLSAA